MEIWKDIPGYENIYQVSNYGNVRSFKNGRWGLRDTPKLLTQSIDNTGYYKVMVNNKLYQTHQLIAITFLSHIPDGFNIVVNHIDNNPLNNNVDNLELVSNRYNSSCHKTDVGAFWHKNNKKWVVK